MRRAGAVALDPQRHGDARAVVARLHAVQGWARGPVESVDLQADDGTDADVVLRFVGPLPARLRLQVSRLADGVSFTLLEGDVSTCSGGVRATGGTLAWEVELAVAVTVPWALWREWEAVAFPAWLDAVISRPR